MNELQISISGLGKIDTNLDELEKELTGIKQRYDGVLVTKDTVDLAKKDRADLNKLVDGIETQRKAIKKQWNEPYNEFEKRVKEILEIIKKPISDIDEQIKAFEKQDKEEKKEKVKELYKQYVPAEYQEYIPFDIIFNEKWLNKSTKENEIISDISMKSTQVKIDMDAIHALNSEIEDQCLKAYKDAGNSLAAAIKRNTDYLSAKAAAEVKAREEAERKVREEQERKAKEDQEKLQNEAEEKAIKEEVVEDLPFEEDLPFPIPVFRFEISGQESIDKVKQFLKDLEITYKEI